MFYKSVRIRTSIYFAYWERHSQSHLCGKIVVPRYNIIDFINKPFLFWRTVHPEGCLAAKINSLSSSRLLLSPGTELNDRPTRYLSGEACHSSRSLVGRAGRGMKPSCWNGYSILVIQHSRQPTDPKKRKNGRRKWTVYLLKCMRIALRNGFRNITFKYFLQNIRLSK